MSQTLRAASLGLGLGTLVGLAEAALHADPTWGGAVWLVGPLVDGLAGALVGFTLGARGLAVGTHPALPLTAAVLLSVGAATWGLRTPAAIEPQPVRVEHPDILWIAISGVPDAALDEPETTPRLQALAAEGARYRRVWAPSASPEVALASLLTGRQPAGHGTRPGGTLPTDVPTVAEVAHLEGMMTRAVLSADASFARGFSESVRPRPARLAGLDPASANVLLVAALDRLLGPRGAAREIAPPADAAKQAAGWLTEDKRQLVFVHLTAADGVPGAAVRDVDTAVGELLDVLRATGRLDQTLVVVSGVLGLPAAEPPTSDAAAALRPEALHVPLIFRLPGGEHAGATLRRQIGTHDVGPSLLGALDHVQAPPWEGVARLGQIARQLALDAHAPAAALQLSAPWPEPVAATSKPPSAPAPAEQAPLGTDGKPDTTPRKRTADPLGPSGLGESWEVAPGAGGAPDPEKAAPNLCDLMIPAFGDEALLSVRTPEEGGWYYAVRFHGYALHTWASERPSASDPWRLYDLKHDPQELGRPLAREAVTCGDRLASDVAADLLARIPALLDSSHQARSRTLAARPSQPDHDRGRASMPDPTRAQPQ